MTHKMHTITITVNISQEGWDKRTDEQLDAYGSQISDILDWVANYVHEQIKKLGYEFSVEVDG